MSTPTKTRRPSVIVGGAIAVVTVATPAAQELTTNAVAVAELAGTVTVP